MVIKTMKKKKKMYSEKNFLFHVLAQAGLEHVIEN